MANGMFKHDATPTSWASYVVGHHPFYLRLWQESHWGAVSWYGAEVAPEQWAHVEAGFERLNAALRLLVLRGQAEAGPLVELHRAKDALAAECADQRRYPGKIEPDVPTPPGGTEWRDLIALSQMVVGRDEELPLWRDVGAVVGQAQYQLWAAAAWPVGPQPPGPGDLQALVDRLTGAGHNSFLLQLPSALGGAGAGVAQPGQGWWGRVTHDYLGLSRLDVELRAALRKEMAPEPVLVLDKDHVRFFGERRAVEDLDEAEVGCLWVLAEHANQDVQRKTIIAEACLGEDEGHLKVNISRLRTNVLIPMAEVGCARSNRPLLAVHKDGYIICARGGPYTYGPYRLALDPALVRVIPPRPEWMA
jgi:hypothetical protein